MVEKLFAKLEGLARDLQVKRLKKIYPEMIGIRIDSNILWQHPGNLRQRILGEYEKKLADVLN